MTGLSAETFTVTGLSESTTYFFAIKTSDEVPNESALSNVPSAATADGTAPDAIADLATGTVTTSSVDLSWTAPGDDGATGTATTYDVRYSTSTITAGNWASATQASGEPSPQVAGSAETFTVTGLSESTTYFFAIKTSDEVPNESPLSNVPSAATADGTAPDAVADLATGTVTTSSVQLSWTAPGDDGATGTATTYDVRYSTSTITAGNWASATQASGEPAPQVAGSAETFTVTGLSESTTYFFAIKTSDEVPNESALSNMPSAATADGTAPDAIADLATGTDVERSPTDVRRALLDEHDHRGQLGVSHTGDGRAFAPGSGQRRDVHGDWAEREHDVLLRDQDVGRSAERECDLECAEHGDSGRHGAGRRRGSRHRNGDDVERGAGPHPATTERRGQRRPMTCVTRRARSPGRATATTAESHHR